jgi:hypothetical protein
MRVRHVSTLCSFMGATEARKKIVKKRFFPRCQGDDSLEVNLEVFLIYMLKTAIRPSLSADEKLFFLLAFSIVRFSSFY